MRRGNFVVLQCLHQKRKKIQQSPRKTEEKYNQSRRHNKDPKKKPVKLRTQIEINEIKCRFFKLINEPNECLRTLTKIKIVDLLPKPGIKWDVSTDPAEIKNNRILQTILQVGKFR